LKVCNILFTHILYPDAEMRFGFGPPQVKVPENEEPIIFKTNYRHHNSNIVDEAKIHPHPLGTWSPGNRFGHI